MGNDDEDDDDGLNDSKEKYMRLVRGSLGVGLDEWAHGGGAGCVKGRLAMAVGISAVWINGSGYSLGAQRS